MTHVTWGLESIFRNSGFGIESGINLSKFRDFDWDRFFEIVGVELINILIIYNYKFLIKSQVILPIRRNQVVLEIWDTFL